MGSISSAWLRWRKRKAIRRIRQELAFWGITTTTLSDAEIENGCSQFARIMANSGVSVKDTVKAFRRVGWGPVDEVTDLRINGKRPPDGVFFGDKPRAPDCPEDD